MSLHEAPSYLLREDLANRKRGGGSRGWRVRDVNQPRSPQELEVVDQSPISSNCLCSDTAEAPFEVTSF